MFDPTLFSDTCSLQWFTLRFPPFHEAPPHVLTRPCDLQAKQSRAAENFDIVLKVGHGWNILESTPVL